MEEKNLRIESKPLIIKGNNHESKLFYDEDLELFLKKYLNADPYFPVFTSGSTGSPKEIGIQKKYMKTSAQKTLDFLRLKKNDTALLCLPTDKIAGIMMLVRWLVGELDLYPVEASARPLDKTTGEFDFAAMVPYQVSSSLDQLHRVKNLIIGGAPVDPLLEEQLQQIPTEVYHTYGMTETISHVAMRRLNGSNRSDYYEAMPGVSFTTDLRTCLVINAPDIGVEALVTNDVVELKSPTNFAWKGRYDNVVNSGGVKLYPEELEKKIGPLGREYFLIGISDEKLGEKLVILMESDTEVEVKDFSYAFEGLDVYQRPKEIIAVKEFSRTSNGKIKRAESLHKALKFR